MKKRWIPLFVLLLGAISQAEPVRDQHVTAELIAENVAFQPGKPFEVGVLLTMDPEWHTYWLNPGDSGLGTTVKWNLPAGFTAGPLRWPYPQRIVEDVLVSYGYEDAVLLRTEITPPATWDSSNAVLKARVDWLMCKEVCIPGRADVQLKLIATNGLPATDGRWAMPFMYARGREPVETSEWSVRAEWREGFFILRLAPRSPAYSLQSGPLYFFPDREDLIDHAAEQQLEQVSDGWLLRVKTSALMKMPPDRIQGTLVGPAGWVDGTTTRAMRLDVALPAAGATQPNMGLSFALLFAFVGGLILNLMPCVFPVLSLKVLGFVEQAGASRGKLIAHATVFASGILVCFWVLAGILMMLRAGGTGIGWGFQLQSPAIVTALTALFFLLGLSLFGLFEFGLSLTAAGAEAQARRGYLGSFFSGLLATIVATPCTAPFMGAALGWALTQSPAAALSIFTSLGVGMATPYLLFATSPTLLKKLPRPGPWMETMKQFMGFLMMATVVWLLWVLGQQIGLDGLVRTLGVLLILAVAGWIAGRWGALRRARHTRVIAHGLALLLVAGSVLYAVQNARPADGEPGGATTTEGGVTWEPWSPDRVSELRAAGKPVFVDFTAAWCLTCQVNKRVVLHQREVEAAFLEHGVATLRADWTDRNEAIAAELARFGRSGVPLYVLYGKNQAEPALLPEILTPRIVLDALAPLR